VATNTADDAGVYRLAPDLALVQTIDVFTPVVDDPYWFGAIAAANALSDVYAMGGAPRLALNFAGFPRAKLPLDILGEILRGGGDKCGEAGVTIVGGHTIDDVEPKYGLAVTGFVHPDRVVTNATAQPGDLLVLTKPLGMGVITTGIKQERTSRATIDEAIRVMAILNRGAADAMNEVGVSAATDVTGFGLLGHLHEMTRAAGVRAHIRLRDVPILEEAWDLARRGAVPGGTKRNRESLEQAVTWQGVEETAQVLLCDAQTSGGLLMAVPESKCERLLSLLREQRTPAQAVVGEIQDRGNGQIIISA
jgi:selenide,water dikinase